MFLLVGRLELIVTYSYHKTMNAKRLIELLDDWLPRFGRAQFCSFQILDMKDNYWNQIFRYYYTTFQRSR